MIRKASIMTLFPGQQVEYTHRHNPIWPELTATLRAHGVHSYSIFLDRESDKLFAYAEIEDEARWAQVAETDVCRRWWAYMKDVMETNPDNSPIAANLEEVFRLGGETSADFSPLDGKRIIVSGGASGIGRAIVSLLAAQGARVLLFDIDGAAVQKVCRELGQGVQGLQADQSQVEEVRQVFQAAHSSLGGVDILVNNAGIYAGGAGDISLEDIRRVVDTNLFGYIACSHEAVQTMGERGGQIVNIGSFSADVREAEHDVYVATKAGIQAFSDSLRKTLTPRGIDVTLIEPALVESGLTVGPQFSEQEAAQKKAEGTMLLAEDIAETVLFCLTRRSGCAIADVKVRPRGQSV